jgi:hypothetical protein
MDLSFAAWVEELLDLIWKPEMTLYYIHDEYLRLEWDVSILLCLFHSLYALTLILNLPILLKNEVILLNVLFIHVYYRKI